MNKTPQASTSESSQVAFCPVSSNRGVTSQRGFVLPSPTMIMAAVLHGSIADSGKRLNQHRFFRAKPIQQPAPKCGFVYAGKLGKRGQCHATTNNADDEVAFTPVVLLHFSTSPSAIVLAVHAIVVDPVKRSIWRATPHVCVEVLKGHPSLVNGDPPSSVSRIFLCGLIEASVLHRSPRFVCTSGAHPVDARLVMGTPASFSPAINKLPRPDDYSFSAITKTLPHNVLAFVWGALNDSQRIKFLTSAVNKVRHFRHLENFTVDGVWQAVVKLLFGSYPSHAAYCTTGVPR